MTSQHDRYHQKLLRYLTSGEIEESHYIAVLDFIEQFNINLHKCFFQRPLWPMQEIGLDIEHRELVNITICWFNINNYTVIIGKHQHSTVYNNVTYLYNVEDRKWEPRRDP